MLRIGVDIGGTFTDFSVWGSEADPYVALKSFKLPTSRPHFADAVKIGIRQIFEDLGASTDTPVVVVHGTTVSTNAVIERSEPPIAFMGSEQELFPATR